MREPPLLFVAFVLKIGEYAALMSSNESEIGKNIKIFMSGERLAEQEGVGVDVGGVDDGGSGRVEMSRRKFLWLVGGGVIGASAVLREVARWRQRGREGVGTIRVVMPGSSEGNAQVNERRVPSVVENKTGIDIGGGGDLRFTEKSVVEEIGQINREVGQGDLRFRSVNVVFPEGAEESLRWAAKGANYNPESGLMVVKSIGLPDEHFFKGEGVYELKPELARAIEDFRKDPQAGAVGEFFLSRILPAVEIYENWLLAVRMGLLASAIDSGLNERVVVNLTTARVRWNQLVASEAEAIAVGMGQTQPKATKLGEVTGVGAPAVEAEKVGEDVRLEVGDLPIDLTDPASPVMPPVPVAGFVWSPFLIIESLTHLTGWFQKVDSGVWRLAETKTLEEAGVLREGLILALLKEKNWDEYIKVAGWVREADGRETWGFQVGPMVKVGQRIEVTSIGEIIMRAVGRDQI